MSHWPSTKAGRVLAALFRIGWRLKRTARGSHRILARDGWPDYLFFICSQNRLRSPTAEAVYADHPQVEVDSAGLNHDATVPLSPEQIEWAELILVMEKSHRNRLTKKFRNHLSGKRIVVLDIPDDYDYMDPALVALIKIRCAKYIP